MTRAGGTPETALIEWIGDPAVVRTGEDTIEVSQDASVLGEPAWERVWIDRSPRLDERVEICLTTRTGRVRLPHSIARAVGQIMVEFTDPPDVVA